MPSTGPKAAFLGESGRRLFTLAFQPDGESRGQLLYVPPFAEEMNRCRAMVSAQARQFAEAGYGCTLLDLWGTGDSEGEFSEAGLSQWLEDIATASASIAGAHGVTPGLWGVRSGALLAWEYARNATSPPPELLLLQPVTSGRRFVRQLLRQRIAAGVGREGAPESAEQIRATWEEGGAVEIGGYLPGGPLMLALEALEIAGPPARSRVTWLDHVAQAGREPGPATAGVVAGLRESGCEVALHCFSGPAVWQLNEREDTPELLGLLGELYTP